MLRPAARRLPGKTPISVRALGPVDPGPHRGPGRSKRIRPHRRPWSVARALSLLWKAEGRGRLASQALYRTCGNSRPGNYVPPKLTSFTPAPLLQPPTLGELSSAPPDPALVSRGPGKAVWGEGYRGWPPFLRQAVSPHPTPTSWGAFRWLRVAPPLPLPGTFTRPLAALPRAGTSFKCDFVLKPGVSDSPLTSPVSGFRGF